MYNVIMKIQFQSSFELTGYITGEIMTGLVKSAIGFKALSSLRVV